MENLKFKRGDVIKKKRSKHTYIIIGESKHCYRLILATKESLEWHNNRYFYSINHPINQFEPNIILIKKKSVYKRYKIDETYQVLYGETTNV